MKNQIGKPQNFPELKRQLQSIQHDTQQLVKDTYRYVKNLNALPSSRSEMWQRKMQVNRELIALQDNIATKHQQVIHGEVDSWILQEQVQAMQQIERDINLINVMFEDLGLLVHQQEDLIDKVGTLQLESESVSKNKTREEVSFGLIDAVILVVIIYIIIWLIN